MGMSKVRKDKLLLLTDVMKDSIWFIIVFFFTVGGVKFLQLSFLWFCWGGIDSVCKGEYEKKLLRTTVLVSIDIMNIRLAESAMSRFTTVNEIPFAATERRENKISAMENASLISFNGSRCKCTLTPRILSMSTRYTLKSPQGNDHRYKVHFKIYPQFDAVKHSGWSFQENLLLDAFVKDLAVSTKSNLIAILTLVPHSLGMQHKIVWKKLASVVGQFHSNSFSHVNL